MNFVLDCSVTVPWLLEDQATDYTEAVMESLVDSSALVPVLWSYEVANALVVAQRKKIVSSAVVSGFLEQLRNMNIAVQTIHDVKYDETLFHAGTSYGLTAYDGAYLKLAMMRGIPLATRDEALKKACAKAGVAIYKPS